ncbi:hypothetical protein [Streptomyces sp. NPDC058545]|uniref:hypothetical protein n=1 Tax=Streptomyces sp. NPDC058545 TaxID=3346544 RepID=UPI00365C65E4
MSLVKRSMHGCPGGLPVLSLTACAVAASLAGAPAAVAEQSTLRDLAAEAAAVRRRVPPPVRTGCG